MSAPGKPYLTYKISTWSKNGLDGDLQDWLNKYARVGWRLHTINIHPDGSFARMVFEAEVTPDGIQQ